MKIALFFAVVGAGVAAYFAALGFARKSGAEAGKSAALEFHRAMRPMDAITPEMAARKLDNAAEIQGLEEEIRTLEAARSKAGREVPPPRFNNPRF